MDIENVIKPDTISVYCRITPSDNRGDLGVLILHPNINTAQAFGAELVLTFVLVFSTYATYDYGRGIPSGVHPLILGVIMTLLNMVGVSTNSLFQFILSIIRTK